MSQNQAKKDFCCPMCASKTYSPVYGNGIAGLLDRKLRPLMVAIFKKDDVGGGYQCDGCQKKFTDPENFSLKKGEKLAMVLD